MGVRDGPEYGPPPRTLPGQATDRTEGGKIPWEGIRHRERVHARLTCIPHYIQYRGGSGGMGGVSGGLQAAGGAAWSGLGGGRTEFGFLRRLWMDRGAGSHLGSRFT